MADRSVRLKPDTTYVSCVPRVSFVSCVSRVSFVMLIAVVSGFSRTAAAPQADLDQRSVRLVSSISDERLGAILKKLESFETRSTLSSTDSPTRGIGAARQWILDEMKSYSPKLQVSFDTHKSPRRAASRGPSICET